ncbi:MAG: hypothetical protein J0L63_19330 [Anaerolineae bacterium]|nr:hypothetical protein [Anaerolineae bacterium]
MKSWALQDDRRHTSPPSLEQFLYLPSSAIAEMVYPKRLSISLLLNGTRRYYLTQRYNAPPQDKSYFPDYMNTVVDQLSNLLTMLADHGFYRVFLPVYSEYQIKYRERTAHDYLLKGIQGLTRHPQLADTYTRSGYNVRFYGDIRSLPAEILPDMINPPAFAGDDPRHFLYYGVDAASPHTYIFQLAYEFGLKHGRAPEWEDMLELYYGDRTMRPLDIMIGFSRLYVRPGIPPLLEGKDRIYATAVTPIAMSETAFRTMLWDFLYARHDMGRDYKDVHPNEFQRLKEFYEANRHTVVGLLKKYEDFCYPIPGPVWPENMDTIGEPEPESLEKEYILR